MIARLRQPLDDLHIAARIDGSAEDDLLKKIGGEQAGTGEGNEITAGAQNLQGDQVQIFVGARRSFELALSLRQLRRIGEDNIEGALLGAQLPQVREYIRFDKVGVIRRQAVEA